MKHYRVNPALVGWDDYHKQRKARCINIWLVVGVAAGLVCLACLEGLR